MQLPSTEEIEALFADRRLNTIVFFLDEVRIVSNSAGKAFPCPPAHAAEGWHESGRQQGDCNGHLDSLVVN